MRKKRLALLDQLFKRVLVPLLSRILLAGPLLERRLVKTARPAAGAMTIGPGQLKKARVVDCFGRFYFICILGEGIAILRAVGVIDRDLDLHLIILAKYLNFNRVVITTGIARL